MRLLILAIVSLFLLGFGHFLGTQGLYYRFSFYDNILHFLYGGLVSLVVSLVILKHKKTFYFVFTFFVVIAAGIGWEFFEFFWDWVLVPKFGLPSLQMGWPDTFLDIFWDSAGSFLTLLCLHSLAFFSKIKTA